ncbi:MAG: uncharacterized protein JWM59_5029 [Verrucomicrobiales bacterium]|nr:uncharacterized protein [Verrucomicrobiales bacterium]
MKKPLKNVAASVKARLLKIRMDTRDDYNELLVRFCLELFLYRLSISPHRDHFVLKSASLFTLWHGFPHRRTRDLDLLGFGDPRPESASEVFREIILQTVDEEDGVVFDSASVEAVVIKSQDEYVRARVTMLVYLEFARIPLQVDVGYGDSIIPPPREETYPRLLRLSQSRSAVLCSGDCCRGKARSPHEARPHQQPDEGLFVTQ